MGLLAASVACTLILVLFGFRDAHRIRMTHGGCAQYDVASLAAARLLSWGIVMSVVALALLPAASGIEARLVILGSDVVLGGAVLMIKRADRAHTHTVRDHGRAGSSKA